MTKCDEDKRATSGFDVGQAASRNVYVGVLPRSKNLIPRHGTLSGEIEAQADGVPGARAYEIQVVQGDPTIEENRKHVLSRATAISITIKGLHPGQIYWVRIRDIDKDGEGLWSQAVSLMVV